MGCCRLRGTTTHPVNVLIIGGFATVPPNYWPMARRLRRRGARVTIASIWTPDWMIAGMLGFGPLMRRARRAILTAYNEGGQEPLMVIAHSGGGLVARLATSPTPFNGRTGGVAEAIGCLVTLGTPHGLALLANRYRHAGHEASAFLDREVPGAFFAPRTGYLTVGSSLEGGSFSGAAGRLADEFFSIAVGAETGTTGDGIVPDAAAHLDGAEQLTLDDVRHGMIGSPWYGDEPIIDEWWPTAVRLWREALEARSEGGSSAVAGANGREPLEFDIAGWSSGSSSGS